jgi:hypothetical protein
VGANLYEAGLDHGRQASKQIHLWLKTAEMTRLNNWTAHEGKTAFAKLQKSALANKGFEHLVSEMNGIADGAGVPKRMIWLTNLLYDLENIRSLQQPSAGKVPREDHCTDIFGGTQLYYNYALAAIYINRDINRHCRRL